jgi:hypothetical protein
MEETCDPSRDDMAEDANNGQPMVCPFCGWEAADGEYVMLLVRFFKFHSSALGSVESALFCLWLVPCISLLSKPQAEGTQATPPANGGFFF